MKIFSKRYPVDQIFRFFSIGILNNIVGYLIYILLTWQWLEPKFAITFTYPLGAMIGYFANHRYVFSYQGNHYLGFFRYLTAHIIGYSANFILLYLFVDVMGYPHQLVQAGSIFFCGFLLFILLRYFVFTGHEK